MLPPVWWTLGNVVRSLDKLLKAQRSQITDLGLGPYPFALQRPSASHCLISVAKRQPVPGRVYNTSFNLGLHAALSPQTGTLLWKLGQEAQAIFRQKAAVNAKPPGKCSPELWTYFWKEGVILKAASSLAKSWSSVPERSRLRSTMSE